MKKVYGSKFNSNIHSTFSSFIMVVEITVAPLLSNRTLVVVSQEGD